MEFNMGFYAYNQNKNKRSSSMCTLYAPSTALSNIFKHTLQLGRFSRLRHKSIERGRTDFKGWAPYLGVDTTINNRNEVYPNMEADYNIVFDVTVTGYYVISHDIAKERIIDRMDGILDSDGEDIETIGNLDHATTLYYDGQKHYIIDTIEGFSDKLPNVYEIKNFKKLVDLGLINRIFYHIYPKSMTNNTIEVKRQLTTSNTSGLSNKKKYIVLHHTGTKAGTINSVLRWLTTGPVSCHYVVDINGDIYKINSHEDVLWHAGVSEWQGDVGINNYGIGIEFIGPLPSFTDKQREAGRRLISYLMEEEGISADRVLRHKDISPGRKVDIDDSFWSNEYSSYKQYQQSLQLGNTLNMFYKNLRETHIKPLPESERAFRDPEGAIERFAAMTPEEKEKELIYLLAIISQRGMGN